MPSGIMFVFVGFQITAFIVFTPLLWLTGEQYEIALILLNITIYLVFAAFPLLLLFIETTRHRPLTFMMVFFAAFFGYIMGYFTSQRWIFKYTPSGWSLVWEEGATHLFLLYLGTFLVFGTGAIIRILDRTFRSGREGILVKKWKHIMDLEGISYLWLGGILITTIGISIAVAVNKIEIGVPLAVVGVILTNWSYIKNPNTFFLSNAEIQSIMIFNAESGVPYLVVGKEFKGPMTEETAVGALLGSTIFQREVTGAGSLPSILVYGDRVVFLASKQAAGQTILAALICNANVTSILPSLRHALRKFVKKYKDKLGKWKGDSQIFWEFIPEMLSIFSYAWSKEDYRRTYEMWTKTIKKEPVDI